MIELTENQKQTILDDWDKKHLDKLTQEVFDNPQLDGRSNEARAIKEYLTSLGKKAKTKTYKPKGAMALTDEQKEFIHSNAKDMSIAEMAKVLFQGVKIQPGSREYKAVYHYTNQYASAEVDMWEEPVDNKQYKPPVTVSQMIGRINLYISNKSDPTRGPYDYNNLKPTEEKNLKSLMSHLKVARFCYQAMQYTKKVDRSLFESTFIRFVHEKASELSPEEVDMYIAAASETVNISQIERQIQKLEQLINNLLDENDTDAQNKSRLSMSMTELINSSREKMDKAKNRLKSIIESLAGSRAKRLANRLQENSSVLNLLEAWAKNEESRAGLLLQGMKEKEEDAEEIKRLENFDAVVCLIAGMTKEEAKNL